MADIPLKTIQLKPTENHGATTTTGPIPVAPVVPAISTTPTGKVPPISSIPTPAPAPSTATQAFKVKTIGMRPVLNQNAAAAPAPAPAAVPVTPVMSATPTGSNPLAAPAANSTATQAIKVRTIGMRPSVNGASPTPTIKLGGAGAAPVSATPTIKLGKPGAPAAGAAPTIKLGGANAPAAGSAPTIKLNAPAAGGAAPTIKLNAPNSAGPSIKLNVPEQANEEEDVENEVEDTVEQDVTTGADIAFFVVRVVAFLIISWCIFVMSAQFANMYNGKNVKVPGLVRVSFGEK